MVLSVWKQHRTKIEKLFSSTLTIIRFYAVSISGEGPFQCRGHFFTLNLWSEGNPAGPTVWPKDVCTYNRRYFYIKTENLSNSLFKFSLFLCNKDFVFVKSESSFFDCLPCGTFSPAKNQWERRMRLMNLGLCASLLNQYKWHTGAVCVYGDIKYWWHARLGRTKDVKRLYSS